MGEPLIIIGFLFSSVILLASVALYRLDEAGEPKPVSIIRIVAIVTLLTVLILAIIRRV